MFHLVFPWRWTVCDWCVTQSKGHLQTDNVLPFESMKNDLLLLRAPISVPQVVQ